VYSEVGKFTIFFPLAAYSRIILLLGRVPVVSLFFCI
jgi:hypothetical protein